MSARKILSDPEAAGIMGMSVEDFRQQLDRDHRSPTGFGMPGADGPHFVRALICNYRDFIANGRRV